MKLLRRLKEGSKRWSQSTSPALAYTRGSQVKAGSMTIPEKNTWPKTVDGATDWEMLFEAGETGLIALAMACTSPEALKQQTQAIIRAIFTRKRDQSIITKVTAYLDKLIPEDAALERLPTMHTGVKQMFRKVKDDRIKKAAAYIKKKQRRKKRPKRKKKPERRINPIIDYFQKNHTAAVILVLVLGAILPVSIYLGSPEVKEPEGDVKEHIGWIDNHIYNHMPQDTWVLQSVRQTKKAQIGVEILITDPDHIDAIHAMRRISRVALLNQVCPAAGSGIEKILEQGWSLWITLNGPDEKLTGGTCHYDE